MSLLDTYTVPCVMREKTRVDDPVGGYATEWVDGVKFDAAWEYISAPEVMLAEKQGVERTYNIYVDRTLDMDYHDVFRRLDTGDTYRVTNPGTDRFTPTESRINRRLIAVEKWQPPREE